MCGYGVCSRGERETGARFRLNLQKARPTLPALANTGLLRTATPRPARLESGAIQRGRPPGSTKVPGGASEPRVAREAPPPWGKTAAVASWNSPVARVSPVHSRRTSSLSPSRRAASYLLVIRL